jgi:uncharacterized membrane protein (DUF106 family)
MNLGWSSMAKFPFRVSPTEFNPGVGSSALGGWLAMVITYVLVLPLAYFVVRATKKSWDYICTTSILHFVLCCIIQMQFPTNWTWWVTILVAAAVTSLLAEPMNYYLVDMREIELDR